MPRTAAVLHAGAAWLACVCGIKKTVKKGHSARTMAEKKYLRWKTEETLPVVVRKYLSSKLIHHIMYLFFL
jgi:hypothetical protein